MLGKLKETAISVRAFACAGGYEAKTDPLDSQVLSRCDLMWILTVKSCGSY